MKAQRHKGTKEEGRNYEPQRHKGTKEEGRMLIVLTIAYF
jgi:hypothetical protein